MLNMIIQKIKNKLWLTVCLVLGLSLLIAVCTCQPMFKRGSLSRLIEQNFTGYVEENNKYPSVLNTKKTFKTDSVSVDTISDKIDEYWDNWKSQVDDVDIKANQSIIHTDKLSSQSSYGVKGIYLDVSYMPEMDEHITIIKGQNVEKSQDGVIDIIASESVLDESQLIVGEEYTFVGVTNKSTGKDLKVRLVGIFKEKENPDVFWDKTPNSFSDVVFVSREDMSEIIQNYNLEKVYCDTSIIIDYSDIDSGNIDDVISCVEEYKASDEEFITGMDEILDSYDEKRKSVGVMLWVLEIPVFGMVIAFIYMVSSQFMETEKSEIAMLKSRGLSRKQILIVYLLQASILAAISIVIGMVLGYGLCMLAASTTDFLTFKAASIACYKFVPSMLIYGLGGAIVGILFILVPAFFTSNISIVEYLSNRNVNKKMFWEKYFIDVILLVLSVYFVYYFVQSEDNIRKKAIEGGTIDPVIFLDSILFMIAFGLIVLRLSHYIVKFVYKIGKKKWKPAIYASFLQITRSFKKQGFISVFMIITVAMGIYNANGARTINRNKEDRIEYEMGGDVSFMEEWSFVPFKVGETVHQRFEEPDYVKYNSLKEEGYVESMARVQRFTTKSKVKGNEADNTIVMGINTKEFGETASLKDELNYPTHWYTYLNELAKNPNGTIISSNLAKLFELKVGDYINFYGVNKNEVDTEQEMRCKVVAIVDVWPGYNQYYYESGTEKENYLMVVNLATEVATIEKKPYEIWVKLADGVSPSEFKQKLVDMNIELASYRSLDEDISLMKSSPEIQITNGIFTMCFLIALILCGVGFLIYWISSIRSRELLFGVYRAMGMTEKDVNKMLINEHIFSTLFSIVSGAIVGMVSTFLFIKLLAMVYLPEKHNMGIYTYFEISDIIKLFAVIFLMIVICLFVLRKLIKSMNITQALKLGED